MMTSLLNTNLRDGDGSFSSSYANGGYRLRFFYSFRTDVPNNRSYVSVQLQLLQASGFSLYIGSRAGTKITINGSTASYTAPAINNAGGVTTNLALRSDFVVNHNVDGTKTININCYYPIKATLAGTYYEAFSVSGNVTLTTINQSAPITDVILTKRNVTSLELRHSASHPTYSINQYSRQLGSSGYINTNENFTITGLNEYTKYSITSRVRATNNKYGYKTREYTTNTNPPTCSIRLNDVGTSNANFTISASHKRGITGYFYSLNNGPWISCTSTFSISSLNANTSYNIKARVTANDTENNIQYGFSSSLNFVSDGGAIKIKKSGTWRNATSDIKKNSAWEDVPEIYIKKNGVWKKTIE